MNILCVCMLNKDMITSYSVVGEDIANILLLVFGTLFYLIRFCFITINLYGTEYSS